MPDPDADALIASAYNWLVAVLLPLTNILSGQRQRTWSAVAALITDAQVREYADRGFLHLDAITRSPELDDLRETYDRLFEPDAPIKPADRIELAGAPTATLPQILNPERYAPQLRDTSAYRNARAVAEQLLGPDVEHMGMHAIRKPAFSGAETPWHQDEAYWDPSYEHRALSIWVPLQEATAENGCLQFMPGSHRAGLRDHVLINPESADGLRLADPELVTGAVAVPVQPGGATVHDARTLHYAGPNGTDEPRRALVMAFRRRPVWRAQRELPWQPRSWYETSS